MTSVFIYHLLPDAERVLVNGWHQDSIHSGEEVILTVLLQVGLLDKFYKGLQKGVQIPKTQMRFSVMIISDLKMYLICNDRMWHKIYVECFYTVTLIHVRRNTLYESD